MSGSIAVSAKHGVNPSLDLCFWCQEAKGLVLFGKLKGDVAAPHKVTMDREPCEKCRKHMDTGVLLISVRDPEVHGDDPKDPYRTGGWVVVRDDFIKRVVTPDTLVKYILDTRVAFLPDSVWDELGLPREKGNN